jgi:hypothetical protein
VHTGGEPVSTSTDAIASGNISVARAVPVRRQSTQSRAIIGMLIPTPRLPNRLATCASALLIRRSSLAMHPAGFSFLSVPLRIAPMLAPSRRGRKLQNEDPPCRFRIEADGRALWSSNSFLFPY